MRNVFVALGKTDPGGYSLGLVYERSSGFCKEGALLNLYTEQILPMENYF